MTTLRLGTRRSPLAMWQAQRVQQDLLDHWPSLEVLLVPIQTTGDHNQTPSLLAMGTKGIFTKEIERALIDESIDAAVHSLKDLESDLPSGLEIGAILKREHRSDVFISKNQVPLVKIPSGAPIATGSLRRRAQLLHYRSDFEIVDLRGNIQTRLNKFYDSDWAGMVLAEAGIVRLGLEEEITERIPFTVMLPAPGQGAIAVEIRGKDEAVKAIVEPLADPDTTICTAAERRLLQCMEGGCRVPIASLGELAQDQMTLYGLIADPAGKTLYRSRLSGNSNQAEQLGEHLAEDLLTRGGRTIIDQLRLGN